MVNGKRERAARTRLPRGQRRSDLDVRLWSTYRMTERQYLALLDEQGGRCAICGTAPDPDEVLAVDHDHACCPGQRSCGACNRGLLCRTCNLTLGALESIGLDRVLAYLGRPMLQRAAGVRRVRTRPDVDAVLTALRAHGAMTVRELTSVVRLNPTQVRAALAAMPDKVECRSIGIQWTPSGRRAGREWIARDAID